MANPAIVYAIPFVLVILVGGEIISYPKNLITRKRKNGQKDKSRLAK